MFAIVPDRSHLLDLLPNQPSPSLPLGGLPKSRNRCPSTISNWFKRPRFTGKSWVIDHSPYFWRWSALRRWEREIVKGLLIWRLDEWHKERPNDRFGFDRWVFLLLLRLPYESRLIYTVLADHQDHFTRLARLPVTGILWCRLWSSNHRCQTNRC